MRPREFLAATATASLPRAIGAVPVAPPSPLDKAGELTKLERPQETVRGPMRYRLLGRTGEEVSARVARILSQTGLHPTMRAYFFVTVVIRSRVDAKSNARRNG